MERLCCRTPQNNYMNLPICNLKKDPSLPLGLPSKQTSLVLYLPKFMLPDFMSSNSHQCGQNSDYLCYMDPCITWEKPCEGQLPLPKTVKVLKYQLTLDIPSLPQKTQRTSVSVHLACNCASLQHEGLGCKKAFSQL